MTLVVEQWRIVDDLSSYKNLNHSCQIVKFWTLCNMGFQSSDDGLIEHDINSDSYPNIPKIMELLYRNIVHPSMKLAYSKIP